ncbi:BQ2448_5823 [Microbotryum intermedium]|uniref:BQ2448_5823 protein n=1 Tax=Microbotryum intermedium TaxID=269621 RepID=A0A238F2B3_9BASI|nr:BQ2448_5823 [Microbotryum intermedium]
MGSSRVEYSHDDDGTPARSQSHVGAVRTTTTASRRQRATAGHTSASTSTSAAAAALTVAPSPITTRSGRALGSVGGKSGPGYSPYAYPARKNTAAAPAPHPHDDHDDDGDFDSSFDSPTQLRRHQHRSSSSSTVVAPPQAQPQRRGGLFSGIKSIPGRALGYIFHRSNSTSILSSSASLQGVRRAVEKEQRSSQSPKNTIASRTRSGAQAQRSIASGTAAGARGMSRSKTTANLNQLSRPLPSSSSLSALSTLAAAASTPPVASSSTHTSNGLPRSSHSTLTMPPSNLNGGTPSFLASTSYSRQGSPAPSSNAGAGYSRRSPSPTRNQLAGTMSAFNFNSHPTHTDAASEMRAGSRAGSSSAAKPPTSNPFGLQSQSPFVAKRRAPSTARSASVSSIAGVSTNGAGVSAAGHSLFPYASPKPRGASPSALSTSRSVSSSLNHKKPYVALNALNSPRARVGSPLNPHFPTASVGGSASVFGGTSVDAGFERARKKQMVWDPEKGLVSREAMEREREAAQAPPPKNEAERILEVLEGMGRTPLGDAQRATFKVSTAAVPQSRSLVIPS